MIAMALVQQKNKKYDLKFKLSVIKYAVENLEEAAIRRFSVDLKRERDWWKNQTELQRLSEEDSKRARLPGGGRKKASEELEINVGMSYQQTGTPRESVPQNDQGDAQMYATVSDSRNEEFVASAGWLNLFLHQQQLHLQKTYSYCPEGCQRIHREAGKVWDVFIYDWNIMLSICVCVCVCEWERVRERVCLCVNERDRV